MLRAIIHNKARRRLAQSMEQDDISMLTEDMLTACVFSRMSYLSVETLSRLLSLFLSDDFASNCGNIQRCQFWPRMHFYGTKIEPDVVFVFERALLAVEAKRWDNEQLQDKDQLFREWLAVREWQAAENEAPKDVPIIQLAIGGHRHLVNGQESGGYDLRVSPEQMIFSRSWERLSSSIKTVLKDCNNRPDTRILDDMIHAMDLHGVLPRDLCDLESLSPWELNHVSLPMLHEHANLRNRHLKPLAIAGLKHLMMPALG